MKKLLSIFIAIIFIMSACISAGAADTAELTFGDDGRFVILQISDPQDDQYPAYDMLKLISLSIEQTNPDLIVFTGDIVEDSIDGRNGVDAEDGREGVVGENYAEILENVKTACKAIFSAAEDADIPFAVTMGNNDYKSGVTAEDWLDIFKDYDNCLVKDESPDDNSRIDYNLEIKTDDGKTVFNLWLADSGQDEFTKQQIDWYKKESDALKSANSGKAVPSLWFQHIQTSDIGNLFEECSFINKGAKKVGEKYYRLNPDIADGYFEEIFVPGATSELFKAWKNQGDVLGAYFGHMHTEGYTGTYDGIELGFTYGCQLAKEGPYGIRVFNISEEDVENYESGLYTYDENNETLELFDGYSNDNIEKLRTVFEYITKAVDFVKTVVTKVFNLIFN